MYRTEYVWLCSVTTLGNPTVFVGGQIRSPSGRQIDNQHIHLHFAQERCCGRANAAPCGVRDAQHLHMQPRALLARRHIAPTTYARLRCCARCGNNAPCAMRRAANMRAGARGACLPPSFAALLPTPPPSPPHTSHYTHTTTSLHLNGDGVI